MPIKFRNLVLFFLLLFSMPVAFAQSDVDYTAPVPLYMLVNVKARFRTDIRMWMYDDRASDVLLTKAYESPDEIAFYCGEIISNPPHFLYVERYYPGNLYPVKESLGYLAYPYPVSQEALNQSPVDLPIPYEEFGHQIGIDTNLVCRFVYVMVAPWKPTSPSEGGIICANEVLTIRSVNNKEAPSDDQYLKSTVEYEYNVADSSEWHSCNSASLFYGGGDSEVSFRPQDKIISVRDATIKKKLRFRCRQKAEYSDGHIFYSPYSEPTGYVEIHPPAPFVDESRIVKTAACPTENNGTITVPSGAVKSNFSRM
ncbi:MAG TPA: hypothetical protein VJ720_00515, partial [Chitinophaga sp.]|nr:hypothetical protein [Chitinophaga sp.]